MGQQPPEELIDAEILSLVRLLNSAPYIETYNSCSGYSPPWTTHGEGRSDGVNREWTGRPYISFRVIGDRESRGMGLDFVDYLIDRLIFHSSEERYEQIWEEMEIEGMKFEGDTIQETERYAEFKWLARSVGMTEGEYDKMSPLFLVRYLHGFTISIMTRAPIDTAGGGHIFEERGPEEVMKVWAMIEVVSREFIGNHQACQAM